MKTMKKLLEQHREEGRFKPVVPHDVKSRGVGPRPTVDSAKAKLKEENDTTEKVEMVQSQLHFIHYACKEILDYIDMGGEVEEWYQVKVAKSFSEFESLHAFIEGEKRRNGMVKEDIEQLDEIGDTMKGQRNLERYVHKAQVDTVMARQGTPGNKDRTKGVIGAAKRLTKSYQTVKNEEVETLEEGKMKEISMDIGHHLDKHINNYKKVGGAEHLGQKTVDVAHKIAKMHNIEHKHAQKFVNDYVDSRLNEDLRNWFDPKHPEGGWKRINSKGEAIGPCAREPGEAKPKCMSNEKRASLTKKERAAAVRSKREHDPNPERKGEPINVSNFGKGKLSEEVEMLEEKNAPTNPSLWARAKALAKSKFDVYPSAYANGWASKWYKSKGGGWKSVNEEVKDTPFEGGKKSKGTVTDKSGAKHSPMSRVRDIARKALERQGKAPIAPSKNIKKMEEASDVPFEGGKPAKGTVTDKSGAKHSPMSRVRDLASKATEKQSNKARIVKDAAKKSKDKFQADPTLSSEIMKQ